MSDRIICRQCGDNFPRSDFSDVFRCPECQWSELLPTVYKATAGASRRAAEAAEANDSPPFELDLDGLRGLPERGFERWVGALLRRVGYDVEALNDVGCIRAERNGHKRIVVCVWYGDRENVGRPECRKLFELMAAEKTTSGMLVSAGSFEAGCNAAMEEASRERETELHIDMVDGKALSETVRSMTSGPLAAWWSDPPAAAA